MSIRPDVTGPQGVARLVGDFNPSAAQKKLKPQVDPDSASIKEHLESLGYTSLERDKLAEPEPKMLALPHLKGVTPFLTYLERLPVFDRSEDGIGNMLGNSVLSRWDNQIHQQRSGGALVTFALDTEEAQVNKAHLLARLRFYADADGLYSPEFTVKTLARGIYADDTRLEFGDPEACIGFNARFPEAVAEAAALFDERIAQRPRFPLKAFSPWGMRIPALNLSSRDSIFSIYIHKDPCGTVYPTVLHTTFDANRTTRLIKSGSFLVGHDETGGDLEIENEIKTIFVAQEKATENADKFKDKDFMRGLVRRIETGIADAAHTLVADQFVRTERSKVERALHAAVEDMRRNHWGSRYDGPCVTDGFNCATLYTRQLYKNAPLLVEIIGSPVLRHIQAHASALAADFDLGRGLRQKGMFFRRNVYGALPNPL